jgi:hypothetical protein
VGSRIGLEAAEINISAVAENLTIFPGHPSHYTDSAILVPKPYSIIAFLFLLARQCFASAPHLLLRDIEVRDHNDFTRLTVYKERSINKHDLDGITQAHRSNASSFTSSSRFKELHKQLRVEPCHSSGGQSLASHRGGPGSSLG